jgi:dienelactone hydrolase
MMNNLLIKPFLFVLLLLTISGVMADTELPEEVIFIPKFSSVLRMKIQTKLETTMFKPEGAGPHPLVIINHGKSPGNTHFQPRYRPLSPVRYFLERNYIVLVPMRQGFSKSEGSYIDPGCNIISNGITQAADVQAALEFALNLPDVNKEQILVVGQSHGGWTSLAFGSMNKNPAVRGIVNFAGGLKKDDCVGWQNTLIEGSQKFGLTTQTPSIWFYGDNDSFFPRTVSNQMFEQYSKGNPNAQFVTFGDFENDSHVLFTRQTGRAIWEPHLEKFLQSIDMPFQVVNAQYLSSPKMMSPPPSGFSEIRQVDQVPHINHSGKQAYNLFLEKPNPRAFAISLAGNFGWEYGTDDPLKGALSKCEKNAKSSCKLYAVDNQVVW